MGNNEYIIRIFYETPDGSSVGMAPIGTGGSSEGSNDAKAKPTPGISAASFISPIVNTGMTYTTQEINTVTGSGQLARKQSLSNAMMKSAMDVSASALGGASVAASVGSAVGMSAAAGGVVGAAIAAISKLLDIATSVADINNKTKVESTAIDATKARATISWDRSRER